MALLGDDGRGFELARKLESQGVWRTWLGDALYSNFIHFLSSSTSWDAFMRADDSKSKPQIQLQLRARALLFDKASISLFHQSQIPANISKLNPNYLELHGDDLYFTLENGSQDGDQLRQGLASTNVMPSKVLQGQSKASSSVSLRFAESDGDAMPQRFKFEELPDTWYTKFFEEFRISKSYRSMFGDRESEKRTPEHMSTYLRVLKNHKRRRLYSNDVSPNSHTNLVMNDNDSVDETLFFPETMFNLNCVPDTAVLKGIRLESNQKIPFNGVLDSLPRIMTKNPVISPIMIERLGIRPEFLNMEQRGNQNHEKNRSQGSRRLLGQEEASLMSQKVVARSLNNLGFESSSKAPLEVLAQCLSCHICKLGRIIKLLADSYRKQCSATELLKMFLQTAGYNNLGTLVEFVRDNSTNVVNQTQQHVLDIQNQMPSHQQHQFQQSQQILRQMRPQMQQMNNPQYLTLQQQQQWERMRRRQQAAHRPGMNMDKDRPMVQVKMESPSDFPLDANTVTSMNSRHPQLRQQQLAAISSLHAQANNQFRPINSLQIPQIHSPNMGMSRAPPVKVEGFQELFSGDSSVKHDLEEK